MLSLYTNRVKSLLFTWLIFLSAFFKFSTGYSGEINQDNNKSQKKIQENRQETNSTTPVLINTLTHKPKVCTYICAYTHIGKNGNSVLVTKNDRATNVWVRKEKKFELVGIVEFVGFVDKINFNKDGSQLCIVPEFTYSCTAYSIKKDDYYMEVCRLKDNSLIREKINIGFNSVNCQCFNPVDNNELFIIQGGDIIIFKYNDSSGWVEEKRIGEGKDLFHSQYTHNIMSIDSTAKDRDSYIFYYGYYCFDGQTIVLRGFNSITILTRNQYGDWDKAHHELDHVLALAPSSTKNEFISITDIRGINSLSSTLPKYKYKFKIQHWYFNGNEWQYTKLAEFLACHLLSYQFSPDQNGFFLGFKDNTAQVFIRNENNDWLNYKIKNWKPFNRCTLHFQINPYSNDGRAIISKDEDFPVLIKEDNTWCCPIISIETGAPAELLSLQMSNDNKRLISVLVIPYKNKVKYKVQLLLKHKIPNISLINFILESTIELDSLVFGAFFIDNSHFAVMQESDVKIYEIPFVTADS